MTRLTLFIFVLVCASLTGCRLFDRPAPEAPPPLADMEEPLPLFEEPDDEAVRVTLDAGAFTGIYVVSGAESLDDLEEGAAGVIVERVVENSPGAIAGIEKGDLILEASAPSDDEPREMGWPSAWRELELALKDGDVITVLVDRAGSEQETTIRVVRRVTAPDREDVERFREEQKVGLVIRTATEVEAREAELPPGAGAVIVGLSKRSPWRGVGLRFNHLITEIDGRIVEHPQVVLDAIREAESGQTLDIAVRDKGSVLHFDAPVSRRESQVQDVSIIPVFGYEATPERSEWSVLYGLMGWESTNAAWRMRLLWLLTFGGGDTDELEEIEISEEEVAEDVNP